MTFKEKDWVKIVSLKRFGQIQKVIRIGLYEVIVGEFTIQCQETNLALAPQAAPKPETVKERKARLKKKAAGPALTPEIDLHGMRVEEAMKFVEKKVNDAILAGADGLRVVHGKGSGKIKGALHKFLKGLEVVKHFRGDEKNEGVTWVYF